MIEEQYVSFETAKLLKEKGFNEHCFCAYHEDKKELEHFSYSVNNYTVYDEWITASTQQMAMQWLREVHGLHISLEPCYDHVSMHVVFLAFVQNVADAHEFFDGRKNIASHPSAETSYELAIKYCLENLI